LSHAATEPNCLNCGAELHGGYCHVCGQKAVSLHLGVHDFAHEATHEFLHLDGKILSTVKLLVLKPGQLTKEFVEGRRARYISPLRVYLTFSLLFFFLASVTPRGAGVIRIGAGSNATLPQNAQEERLADEIAALLQKQLPRAMFLLMPLYGLLTLAFYRRAQPYYVPHLYYSVHMHAFTFLLMSVVALIGFAGTYGKAAGSILSLVCIPYHYLALRRFFGESRKTTAWKGTVIGFAYLFVILALLTGLAIYTMQKVT
jgi:hypothetical protein